MDKHPQLDVVCIGNLNFDITFLTDVLPGEHEKVRCDEVYTGFGGAAANTCFWLTKLGLQVGMVGSLGHDLLSKMHLQELRRLDIDTSCIKVANAPSGIAVIFSKQKAKRMIKTPGANEFLALDTDYLLGSKHVHLSGNSEEVVRQAVNFCRKKNITVSYDPAETPCPDILEQVDYLFMNEDELKRFVKQKSRQKAIALLNPKHLIMTKNGGGCVIKSRDGIVDIHGFKIKAKDTTGAGDAFDAGFIYGLLKKKKLFECGYLGVAAASLKVQHIGTRSGDIDPASLASMVSEHRKQVM